MRGLTLKALLPASCRKCNLSLDMLSRGNRAFKLKPRPHRKYLLGRCYEAGNNANFETAGGYAHAGHSDLNPEWSSYLDCDS